jgi:hypothetical protein
MSDEAHSEGPECGIFGCVFKVRTNLEMDITLVLC